MSKIYISSLLQTLYTKSPPLVSLNFEKQLKVIHIIKKPDYFFTTNELYFSFFFLVSFSCFLLSSSCFFISSSCNLCRSFSCSFRTLKKKQKIKSFEIHICSPTEATMVNYLNNNFQLLKFLVRLISWNDFKVVHASRNRLQI